MFLSKIVGTGFLALGLSASVTMADNLTEQMIVSTYNQAIDQGAGNGDRVAIVFEDDDFSQIFRPSDNTFYGLNDPLATGDILRGVVRMPSIGYGTPVDPITLTGKDELLTTSGFFLYAVYELEFTENVGFGALASDGIVYRVYEAPTQLSIAGGLASTYETQRDLIVNNSTEIAQIGFTGVGAEFFAVDGPASGTPLETTFSFSLNFIDASGITPDGYAIARNTPFNTEMYGFGQLTDSKAANRWYTVRSEADFLVVFTPTPAAAGLGMVMMGALAVSRRQRKMA